MAYLSVAALLNAYLDLSPLRPVTHTQHGYHLRSILARWGRRSAARLTCADLSGYVEDGIRQGLALTTLAARGRILKAAYRWGVTSGRLASSPIDGYRLPRARAHRISPPSRDELRAMLRVCAPHIARVIKIGWYLGPRIGPSELFRLRWADVDLASGILRMPCAAKVDGDDMRDLPIRGVLLREMRRWRRDDGDTCPWVIHWRSRPVRHINRAFDAARQKAGIARKFTPYSLRHAFPTQAIAHGAALKAVCAMMGHKSPRMVLEVYQHIDFATLAHAAEKTPRL